MISRIVQTLVILGLVLLAAAGLLLAIAHHPESWTLNFQAETLANFAYGLFVLAVIINLFDRPRT